MKVGYGGWETAVSKEADVAVATAVAVALAVLVGVVVAVFVLVNVGGGLVGCAVGAIVGVAVGHGEGLTAASTGPERVGVTVALAAVRRVRSLPKAAATMLNSIKMANKTATQLMPSGPDGWWVVAPLSSCVTFSIAVSIAKRWRRVKGRQPYLGLVYCVELPPK